MVGRGAPRVDGVGWVDADGDRTVGGYEVEAGVFLVGQVEPGLDRDFGRVEEAEVGAGAFAGASAVLRAEGVGG